MGTFITIAIFAINLFAIILNFKMLKGMEINKILMYIIITEIVLLITEKIIFNIATVHVDTAVSSMSQNMVLFTFQGMNMIIISSPLAKILGDYRANSKKTNNDLSSKIVLWLIFVIVVIVFECIYIRNIENGISNMKR